MYLVSNGNFVTSVLGFVPTSMIRSWPGLLDPAVVLALTGMVLSVCPLAVTVMVASFVGLPS